MSANAIKRTEMREWERRGWVVEKTSNNHLRLYLENEAGTHVLHHASSPSDHRAFKNNAARMRRCEEGRCECSGAVVLTKPIVVNTSKKENVGSAPPPVFADIPASIQRRLEHQKENDMTATVTPPETNVHPIRQEDPVENNHRKPAFSSRPADQVATTEDEYGTAFHEQGAAIAAITGIKSEDRKRIRTNLHGIYLAVLYLLHTADKVTPESVAEIVGASRSSAYGQLSELYDIGVLCRYVAPSGNGGRTSFYMVNNSANRQECRDRQRQLAEARKKVEKVTVQKDELDQLREFKQQFEGIDLDKLRDLLS